MMMDESELNSCVGIAKSFNILSSQDKTNLFQWRYKVVDNSIVSYYLDPLWTCIHDTYIPVWIAPNVLTLCGFACVIMAFLLVMNDLISSLWIAILIFLYQSFDAIDGKQARRINNSTAMGELLDHGCDCLATVLLTCILANLFLIKSPQILWQLVSIGQLIFAKEHIRILLFPNSPVVFPKWTSPGELLIVLEVLLVLHWMNPWLFVDLSGFSLVITFINSGMLATSVLFYYECGFWHLACCTIVLGFIQDIPGLVDIVVYGMVFTMLTFEVMISKMARSDSSDHPNMRPFSYGALTIVMISQVSPVEMVLCLTSAYYIYIFYDLFKTSKLPFLSVFKRNCNSEV